MARGHAQGVDYYLTFRLEAQSFGIPAGRVREVLQHRPVFPLPLAPPAVRGLTDLRGVVVTVVDLRRRFGLADAADGDDGTLGTAVIVESGGEPVCIALEQIDEILSVPRATREEAPPSVPAATRRFLAGVCKLEKGLLLVLDIDAVLELDRDPGTPEPHAAGKETDG